MTAAGLKDLFERKRRAIRGARPFGARTGQARVRLRDGLRCEVEEGELADARSIRRCEAAARGTAPHPAQMMRAAIVACLAMGYRQWGARLGVAIDEIEVDVLCETDVRGQLGIADVADRLAADHRRRLHRQPRVRGGRAARGRDGGSPEPAARQPVARDRARAPPAHRSRAARRPDMDARVFRRVQRYGWDAATNAYDRGWVPLLERLTAACVDARGAAAGRARAGSGDRDRRGRVRGAAGGRRRRGRSPASTCPREDGHAGELAGRGRRRRATSSSSAATWRRPAPPTARSTRSPARSA